MSEPTTLPVQLKDGCCRSCGGELRIFNANDWSLEVECIDEASCGDAYRVEPDALNDGGITYWPQAMVIFGDEPWE